jgi:hypothetical protein
MVKIVRRHMLCTRLQEASVATGGKESDACALYFVQFVMDMILGMLLVWAMVRTQEFVAYRYVLADFCSLIPI